MTAALELDQPPARQVTRRASRLDPYKAKIDALLAKYPELSAVRIREEIARGPDGYTGSAITVRRYLRTIRPERGRVYQEVHYEPAQAMQVDWGECGRVAVGNTTRKVSVFVAVLCYSRLMYIEFTLSQRKAEFYRGLVHALEFFGGSPRAIIFDNLKAAVLNGSGRAACFHPEFLALCGYLLLAADRLRTARPGIERDRRGRRALREAQRPGRTWRGTGPLRGLPGLGTRVARPGGQRADCTRRPASGRWTASSRSGRCCGRCRRSPSTPTRSCRPWSARMRGSSSTATATRCRRSSCAGTRHDSRQP